MSLTFKEWVRVSKDRFQRNLSSISREFSTIGVGNLENLHDQEFTNAKNVFFWLYLDTDPISENIKELISSFQALIKAFCIFADNNLSWVADAPDDIKMRAVTLSYIVNQADILTSNFLNHRTHLYIFRPFSDYQTEYLRISEIQKKRKEVKLSFQLTKLKLNKTSPTDEALQKESQLLWDEFQTVSKQFKEETKNLVMKRKEMIKQTSSNMVAIFNQYLMQIFCEMQKIRTAFPQSILTPLKDKCKEPIILFPKNQEKTITSSNLPPKIPMKEPQLFNEEEEICL